MDIANSWMSLLREMFLKSAAVSPENVLEQCFNVLYKPWFSLTMQCCVCRSVSVEERAFALGIQFVLFRVFGKSTDTHKTIAQSHSESSELPTYTCSAME